MGREMPISLMRCKWNTWPEFLFFGRVCFVWAWCHLCPGSTIGGEGIKMSGMRAQRHMCLISPKGWSFIQGLEGFRWIRQSIIQILNHCEKGDNKQGDNTSLALWRE